MTVVGAHVPIHAHSGGRPLSLYLCQTSGAVRRTTGQGSWLSSRIDSQSQATLWGHQRCHPVHLMTPPFYSKPTSAAVQLGQQPRLASWNAVKSPDQVRLAAYLAGTEAALAEQMAENEPPLVLRLDVGLPDADDLLETRDLDNYLHPLAARLAPFRDVRFVSFWATKQHAAESFVRVNRAFAVASDQVRLAEVSAFVETSAAADAAAYKAQVRDQLPAAGLIPPGPVRLELSFVVGPSRNWMNLWKPTIDALDPILGRTYTEREWHPKDGRIVELGLHCAVDPSVRHHVRLAIRASSVPAESPR